MNLRRDGLLVRRCLGLEPAAALFGCSDDALVHRAPVTTGRSSDYPIVQCFGTLLARNTHRAHRLGCAVRFQPGYSRARDGACHVAPVRESDQVTSPARSHGRHADTAGACVAPVASGIGGSALSVGLPRPRHRLCLRHQMASPSRKGRRRPRRTPSRTCLARTAPAERITEGLSVAVAALDRLPLIDPPAA